MRNLRSLNKYFVRHKWRLLAGLLFVAISNIFAVVTPAIVRNVLDEVQSNLGFYRLVSDTKIAPVYRDFVFQLVFWNGILLLVLALLRGVFMFFMRQTIIVMSRHIEYDQKSEIYAHYQSLPQNFFKTNATGDLMNRIAEDVSRVRSYTGPSIMYFTNMLVMTVMSIAGMLRVNAELTLYVITPLPLLAITMYKVNKIIFKKSGQIQNEQSKLTTVAQESYSGIRIIKAFVQEKTMIGFFNKNAEDYKKSSINLSLTEAFYFPAINLFIGLSMLITVLIGGFFAIHGKITTGNIAEFVIYINMLTFPISSIGMVASMTQRAGASQLRIDEFLETKSDVENPTNGYKNEIKGAIEFKNVTFTYPHTGITALKNFNLSIKPGEKVAIMGKTGAGKSSIAQLLLRMYDPTSGAITIDGHDLRSTDLYHLRKQIAYTPQDAYLFSDTIANNIRFGKDEATDEQVKQAATFAAVNRDIEGMPDAYGTQVGERGVTLSGGQKQRIILARALIKNSPVLMLDDCLSAVDTKTEAAIVGHLSQYLADKTALIITHRIFAGFHYDKIIVLDEGAIVEAGTHEELMALNGRYSEIFRHQTH